MHLSSITARVLECGPMNTERKTRTCLKCSRLFNSAGPGNRICRNCQRINDRLPRFTEEQMQKQRGAKRHNGEIIEPVLDE